MQQEIAFPPLIWDGHAGVYPHPDTALENLSHWREAGVSFVSLNVYYDVMPPEDAIPVIEAYHAFLDSHPQHYVLARSTQDVLEARSDGKLAVAFDLEGLNVLEGDVGQLERLHRLGVRQALFAYNLNNDFCGGCHDTDTGLTPLGKQALAEMNRLGILVDASHCGVQSSRDMAALSSKPILFSHSNPKSVWEHDRNITTEQMKACAATGGVVGICGIGIFLGANDSSSRALVRSICHIADTIGVDHTGISLDYVFPDVDLGAALSARPDYWPAGQGYDTPGITAARPTQFTEITQLLNEAGFHTDEIARILGGNFLRVAQAVWG